MSVFDSEQASVTMPKSDGIFPGIIGFIFVNLCVKIRTILGQSFKVALQKGAAKSVAHIDRCWGSQATGHGKYGPLSNYRRFSYTA